MHEHATLLNFLQEEISEICHLDSVFDSIYGVFVIFSMYFNYKFTLSHRKYKPHFIMYHAFEVNFYQNYKV